jgi:thioredoxin reductase (NADPH)
MTHAKGAAQEATRRLPAIVIVDADADARGAVESALSRRFGADYRVLTADSADAGLAALEHLARHGEDVALAAVDLTLPEIGGVALVEQVRALHASAKRALLVAMNPRRTRIPFDVLPTIHRAMALGQVDFWILKGWVTPEEWLYPQVQAALSAWTASNRPHHEVVRVVGER